MEYAKLINGIPSYASNPIIVDGKRVGNPPPEIYEAVGYKPVVYTDMPCDAPAGYQWTETWAEEDGNILQGWELVEVPITEEDALVKYVNETTGKNDETLIQATESLVCFIEGGE